ncbi:replication protein, partial [uncultured marine virus]
IYDEIIDEINSHKDAEEKDPPKDNHMVAESYDNVSSNSSKLIGNTSISTSNISSKKKQVSCAIHWMGTLNNYTNDDDVAICGLNRSIVPCYVFQEEVGECGTPHLQIYIQFKKKSRPDTLKLTNKIHWEAMKRKSTPLACKEYCSKDETRI